MTNVELCEFLRDSLELWGVNGVVLSVGQEIRITSGRGTEIAICREAVAGEPAVWRVQTTFAEASSTRSTENHSVVGLLRKLKALVGAEGDGKLLRIGIARSAPAGN